MRLIRFCRLYARKRRIPNRVILLRGWRWGASNGNGLGGGKGSVDGRWTGRFRLMMNDMIPTKCMVLGGERGKNEKKMGRKKKMY